MRAYTAIKKRRAALFAACVIAALCLAGCSVADQTASAAMPLGTGAPPAQALSQLSNQTALIYVPDSELSGVSVSVQTIQKLPGESVYASVIRELLSIMKSNGSAFSLLSLALTDSVANVDISADEQTLSPQIVFALAYCVTNTLTEYSEIDSVNILINDMAISYNGAPYGTLNRFDDDFATEYWRMTTAYSDQTQAARQSTRTVTFYYSALHTSLLLGEAREAVFSSFETTLAAIVSELAKGPRDTGFMTRLLPATAYLMRYDNMSTDTGTRLTLYISGSVYDFAQRNDIDIGLIRASVAMTIFDYYPGVELMSIYFDGVIDDEGGDIFRTDCELALGTPLTLYYPLTDDSKIAQVRRVVPSYKSGEAQTLIDEMFAPLSGAQTQSISAMLPSDVTRGDILSITLTNNTAVVNISQRFLERLRCMEPTQERNTVYCIVNTLCKSGGASSVMLYAQNKPCGNVSGRINLDEPLMFNPGIVK